MADTNKIVERIRQAIEFYDQVPSLTAPQMLALLDERDKLLNLITDIDASDFLEHSVRCTIHAHGDLANAVCSCGLNDLQERINEAQA